RRSHRPDRAPLQGPGPGADISSGTRPIREPKLFVEVVRLFMVMLGMAGGFWLARAAGVPVGSDVAGVAGVLGCLVGYVGGGVVGRILDRAMGVVARTTDRIPPARLLAGLIGVTGGAVLGAVVAVPIALLVPPPFGIVGAGLLVWIIAFTTMRITA